MAMDDEEVEVVESGNTPDSEIADYLVLSGEKYKEKQFTVYLVVCKEQTTRNIPIWDKGSAPSEREFTQAKRVVTGRWN